MSYHRFLCSIDPERVRVAVQKKGGRKWNGIETATIHKDTFTYVNSTIRVTIYYKICNAQVHKNEKKNFFFFNYKNILSII